MNVVESTGLSVKLMKGQSEIWRFLATSPLVPESERPRFLKMLENNEGQHAFIQKKFEQVMATFPIVPPLPPGDSGKPPPPGS